MVVDGQGNPIQEAIEYYKKLENIVDLVKFLSIRCPTGNPEYATGAEVVFATDEIKIKMIEAARLDKQKARKKPAKAPKAAVDEENTTEAQTNKRQQKRDELVDIMPDDPIYAAVGSYIISEFGGAPIVTHVKKTAGGDCYIVNTHCHFCENKVMIIYFMILKPFLNSKVRMGTRQCTL
jgi:hypothetical protein